MNKRYISTLTFLYIIIMISFGSKIAQRGYLRDVTPKPLFTINDCVKLAYHKDGLPAMIDKVDEDQYLLKFYQESPHWTYDDGDRFYDPEYKIVESRNFSIKEGNTYFKSVECPSEIYEIE